MSKSFTDNFIADTYTGILHSDLSLPLTGQVTIYDGVGNISALTLGVTGEGGSIIGKFSASSAIIPIIEATSIVSTAIDSININNTKLNSVSINTDSLSSNTIAASILNSTTIKSNDIITKNITITSGNIIVSTIENIDITTKNIIATTITATSVSLSGNLTAGSIDVVDISSTGDSNFKNIAATRIITESLISGNVEYPISTISTTLYDLIYPVGSIYLSIGNTNPTTQFPGTTWINAAKGLFLVGVGTGTDIGGISRNFTQGANTNGEYAHTLTIPELPAHSHTGRNIVVGSNGVTDPNMVFNTLVGVGVLKHEGSGHSYAVPTSSTSGKADGELIINNTGSGQSHNVTPPAFGVYVWQRTV